MAGDTAKVTWIGHATSVIDIGGENVLVDPLFRSRCRHLSGYGAVLITHAHIDHLNRWTLASLDKSAKLIVPKGAGALVSDLGFSQVVEIEPGDQLTAGKLDIIAVETRHDAGRWRKGDKPICAGYVVARNDYQVHHAGDVDMSDYDVFEEIGKRFHIDATLLPIGGMLPVWYYRWRQRHLDRGVHIDPDTALHIAERLGAKQMIPVHWGTVNLRFGPPSMPVHRLRKISSELGLDHLVKVLGHGAEHVIGSQPSEGDSSDAEADQSHDDAHDAAK